MLFTRNLLLVKDILPYKNLLHLNSSPKIPAQNTLFLLRNVKKFNFLKINAKNCKKMLKKYGQKRQNHR